MENGNAPPITKIVKGVETIIAPATTEEKAQRRLELKSRSTLLRGIPNEHQLKFNSIKYAKSLLQAVEKKFGGNAATKKTQMNLLNQLEIHGESISQEDVNQKFLRSLSLEWNTHTIVWRNKPEIDTLSLDDLYNNLKIYELETIGFDKYKLECYNCHKRGHFARECKAPRNQENRNRENTRIVVPLERTTSNTLMSCDGSGYDWSNQAEEGPTNFALMAYSSTRSNSEVSNDSNYSSSCLENVKIIKEQNKQLLKDLRGWEKTSEITVVILVRDRCPRGKGNLPRLPIRTNIIRLATPSIGSIRIHIEQRIAAMMGYRGGRIEGDEEKLDDEYEGLWR
ncbi:ribonuclease H-like domain-containing protein [Tanacetum coccineum]